MDKIIIKGLNIFAYHGVNPEEKENGQHFLFDIEMTTDTSKSAITDDINDTVSYSDIIKKVTLLVKSCKYNLIETLANKIANMILENYSQIYSVEVTVKKPEAPMKATFDYSAINIKRNQI